MSEMAESFLTGSDAKGGSIDTVISNTCGYFSSGKIHVRYRPLVQRWDNTVCRLFNALPVYTRTEHSTGQGHSSNSSPCQ